MLMRMPQTQSCMPNTQFEDAHFCRQSNAATVAAQTNATTTCAATATGCDWHLQPTYHPQAHSIGLYERGLPSGVPGRCSRPLSALSPHARTTQLNGHINLGRATHPTHFWALSMHMHKQHLSHCLRNAPGTTQLHIHCQLSSKPSESRQWAIRARLTIRCARPLVPSTRHLAPPCLHYSARRSQHPETRHAPMHSWALSLHAHAQAALEPVPEELDPGTTKQKSDKPHGIGL